MASNKQIIINPANMFERDAMYSIGVVRPRRTGEHGLRFQEDTDNYTFGGSYLIDTLKTPDAETYFKVNPNKLNPKLAYSIYKIIDDKKVEFFFKSNPHLETNLNGYNVGLNDDVKQQPQPQPAIIPLPPVPAQSQDNTQINDILKTVSEKDNSLVSNYIQLYQEQITAMKAQYENTIGLLQQQLEIYRTEGGREVATYKDAVHQKDEYIRQLNEYINNLNNQHFEELNELQSELNQLKVEMSAVQNEYEGYKKEVEITKEYEQEAQQTLNGLEDGYNTTKMELIKTGLALVPEVKEFIKEILTARKNQVPQGYPYNPYGMGLPPNMPGVGNPYEHLQPKIPMVFDPIANSYRHMTQEELANIHKQTVSANQGSQSNPEHHGDDTGF